MANSRTTDEAKRKLADLGQVHLLETWDMRTPAQQERLVADLIGMDLSIVDRFAELTGAQEDEDREIRPAPYVSLADRAHDTQPAEQGKKAIREGQSAFLTVAGGQGSRLGYEGPKGMYPVTPIRRASLFQVFAEKLLGYCRSEGARIPWYIMTSVQNDEPTREYFRQNRFFGIPEEDVIFFTQGMLPTLSSEGRLLLAPDGGLFKNPDGHGGMVTALQRQGVLKHMQDRGVEFLFYFQVDNPLVQVPDPLFLGHHLQSGAQAAAKAIAKRSPDEKLGVIALRGEEPCIIEYSDLSEKNMNARGPDGKLLFLQGSIAIHIFSVSFLARKGLELPLHVARKKVQVLDPVSGRVREREGVKFERFIFDLLPMSRNVLFYETSREEEFSPVKNAEGLDSPATSERDQILRAARMLSMCGIDVPRDGDGDPLHKLEISPLFARDVTGLREKLSGADIRIDGDRVFE
jgi:UDP-N-acetylglucosamine/UDP-N-acetylgalactosamine diphosphorylase